MKIEFKKGLINKPNVLSITRSNGTTSWCKLQPGLEDHDLAHFAVESVMGYKKGFYGLIDGGIEVKDFELPKDH